jgi:hypothetical protein
MPPRKIVKTGGRTSLPAAVLDIVAVFLGPDQAKLRQVDLLRLITQTRGVFPKLQELHCRLDRTWDQHVKAVLRTLDRWIQRRWGIKTVTLTYNVSSDCDETSVLQERLRSRGSRMVPK